jgi:DNA-binding response OmpR family regulator
VVEYEADMAQVVCEMLLSGNVCVELFPRGADLLRSVNLLQFNAVVLALGLPEMDGFELMKELAGKSVVVPILLMSESQAAVVRAAMTYGNSIGLHLLGHLIKPFSRDELFIALGIPQ